MAGAESRKTIKDIDDTLTKAEVTRQRIIDAAARVFAQKGYAHTRLSDIAKEAESHAGGIYYYFSSREELVEEVLQLSTRHTIETITKHLAALRKDAGAADKLKVVVKAQIAEIMAKDAYTAAFLKIYSQVPEDIKQRHRPVLREFVQIWRQIIREGQASGEIRLDIDPAIIRLSLIGSIQWSVEWAQPQTSSAEDLADQMSKLFIDGVLSKQLHAKPAKRTVGKSGRQSGPSNRAKRRLEGPDWST